MLCFVLFSFFCSFVLRGLMSIVVFVGRLQFALQLPTTYCLCDEWIVNVQRVHSQINCHYISFVMPLLLRVFALALTQDMQDVIRLWWCFWDVTRMQFFGILYALRMASVTRISHTMYTPKINSCNNQRQSKRRRTDLSESFTRCCMLHARSISLDWWSCFNGHRCCWWRC